MENERMYEVKVLEKKGTCDNSLFEKMAKKGDITAQKITDLLGAEVKITGYAKCEIKTNDKQFTMNYYDTEEYGMLSSGSEIFFESVVDYFGEVEFVKIVEVKTKKGKTYKAVPVLSSKKETIKNEDEKTEDMPF